MKNVETIPMLGAGAHVPTKKFIYTHFLKLQTFPPPSHRIIISFLLKVVFEAQCILSII